MQYRIVALALWGTSTVVELMTLWSPRLVVAPGQRKQLFPVLFLWNGGWSLSSPLASADHQGASMVDVNTDSLDPMFTHPTEVFSVFT